MKYSVLTNQGAINLQTGYYQLYICPLGEDTTKLENALVNTDIIDWNKCVNVPSGNSQVLALLKRVCEHLKLKIKCTDPMVWKHLINKGSKSLLMPK
jgi:hypothetical protein